MPEGHRVALVADDGGVPSTDLAAGRGKTPEQALHELAAPGADQAVEADDLALAHLDRNVVKALAGELFGREDGFAERNLLLEVDLFDRSG